MANENYVDNPDELEDLDFQVQGGEGIQQAEDEAAEPDAPETVFWGLTKGQLKLTGGIALVGFIAVFGLMYMMQRQAQQARANQFAAAGPSRPAPAHPAVHPVSRSPVHAAVHRAPAQVAQSASAASGVNAAASTAQAAAATSAAPTAARKLATLHQLAVRMKVLNSEVKALAQAAIDNHQKLKALEHRQLPSAAATVADPKAANPKAVHALRAQFASLEHQIALLRGKDQSEAQRAKALAGEVAKLKARPVLPGWNVVAVTARGAVLSGPGDIVRVVHAGQKFYGLKITKLRPSKAQIVTSAGILSRS